MTPTTSITTLDDRKLKDIVFSPCLAVSPKPPGGNQIPWILLIHQGVIPYAIDPNIGIKTNQLLPNPERGGPYANDFAVSPDGKWLAYNLYGEHDVSLVVERSSNLLTNSSKGHIVQHWNQPTGLEGWLNNEWVMRVTYKDPDWFGSTLVRNPFTGEQHEFSLKEMPNYLDYQPGMSGSYLMDHGNLVPDPTLKRVVYPAWSNGDFQLALWDVENKQALASLPYTVSQLSRYPFWSQDGRDFLIVGLTREESMEWHRITRDGAIRQLTHFGEFLQDVEFNYPSRSWDGRYLAFQLLYNTRKDSKYLILDLKSQSLVGIMF